MLQPPHHLERISSATTDLTDMKRLEFSLSLSTFLFLSVPRHVLVGCHVQAFCGIFPHLQRKQSTSCSLETIKLFRNCTCMSTLVTILSYQCRNTHDTTFSNGCNTVRPVTKGEKILIFFFKLNWCVINTRFV